MAAWAGAVAAASEAVPLVRDGVSLMPVVVDALGRPAFIAAHITGAVALAIWFWRRQRLLEQDA